MTPSNPADPAAAEITAAEIIARYGLQPHPEGGYFVQTYVSSLKIPRATLGANFHGDRPVSTAILYMLVAGAVSKLHRLASDEVWHWHAGGPLVLCEFDLAGRHATTTTIGQNLGAGATVQHTVPAGRWFGAYLPPHVTHALVGCTVAPGFDFAEFEFARPAELLAAFPDHAESIRRLT